MGMEFELTIRITGTSLDEIDTGLTNAAGARLQARMSPGQPNTQAMLPKAFKPPQPTFKGQSESKRGRPPLKEGEVGKYVKKDQPSFTPPSPYAPQMPQMPETPPPVPTVEPAAVMESVSPHDEAREVIQEVSAVQGLDSAKQCLQFFGVTRVSELPDSSLKDFAAYCRKVLGG